MNDATPPETTDPTSSSYVNESPPSSHPFTDCVNPYLGRALAKLKLDREFVRGEGSYLIDRDGRRYLDFIAQYGALPFGFNPPEIWDAVTAVRESGEPSFVQPSLLGAAGELARRLVDVTPKRLEYVTFSNSGTEAVEAAIKLSRAATGRLGILATSNGFHGKTLGSLSATGNTSYQQGFGAPLPDFDTIPFGDAEALEKALTEKREFYAAFIVEPIQGEGGIVEPPPGYLLRAQALCRGAGVLFVVDEIQTGLGRTGALFACDSEGVAPDVMTLAKALGGGLLPIGATLCTQEAYTAAFARKHSSTFAGNALACRVGLATLERLEQSDRALIQSVADNGARVKQRLEALRERFPQVIRAVRGRGYMLGVQLSADTRTWRSSLLAFIVDRGMLVTLVASYLLNVERVRTAPTLNASDVLRIEPPLTATWIECSQFLAAFERAIRRVVQGDTAGLVGHLIGLDSGEAVTPVKPTREQRPLETVPSRRRRSGDRENDPGRFAFLLHPLDVSSYSDFDPSLARLTRGQITALRSRLNGELQPTSIGETAIVSNDGCRAVGEFIGVLRDAEELLKRPRADVLAEIERASRMAMERGAKIIGLGGFLSVVTRGGVDLRDRGLPAMTTGNSYTVAAAREAIHGAANEIGLDCAQATVAVVGAGGAIGRAIAMTLASGVARLVLIANPNKAARSRRRLDRVVADVLHYAWISSRDEPSVPGRLAALLEAVAATLPRDATRSELFDAVLKSGTMERLIVTATDRDSWLPRADVVITATSSTADLVSATHLKEHAIVCDVSRPSNVSPDLERSRPDVRLIEGGVVRVPGAPDLGCRFGLPTGYVYACMAETMMLALEKRYRDTSLGLNLDLDTVEALRLLSRKHGFRAYEKHLAPSLENAG